MAKVVLYHTDGCHLCEQAQALLQQHPDIDAIELRDIIDQPHWLEAYQIRIPVLALAHNPQAELGWPFDQQAISELIKQYGPN
ncbi:glutaredoxin family protein [Pseudoalteromonas sp. BDTF-M6]|uniref:glutaredoxin family protein n=1 Tax=Pseudoalteromonas sp. BDTF-M6 TaxID=2796132 RepID=UPI001BAE7BFA|nr:glutaredoxin family protein [Pseudoalteromonas sp. BDTF-M6]MBS3796573.1 glutaredoxin family protein [Pseudoalteromonas sp. BDTF-M6]